MRVFRRWEVLFAGGFLLSAACASAGSTGQRINPDLITRTEIQEGQFQTAQEAVQRLRPRWLRATRVTNSFIAGVATGDALGDANAGGSRAQVVLDGVPVGVIEELARINARDIETMEWLDGTSAVQRWGTGYDGGAISITTRRG